MPTSVNEFTLAIESNHPNKGFKVLLKKNELVCDSVLKTDLSDFNAETWYRQRLPYAQKELARLNMEKIYYAAAVKDINVFNSKN